MAGPLTPDFYRYEWHSLSGVRLDGEFVTAEWPDGAELPCFSWWLAEQRDYEASSREGLLEPCDLGDHWQVAEAWVEPDGSLAVRWAHDDVVSRYHPGWLRHIADGQFRPESFLSDPIPWDSSVLPEPVTYHGPTVLADTETFRQWLNDLAAYGLTRLTVAFARSQPVGVRGSAGRGAARLHISARCGTSRPSPIPLPPPT